MHFLQLAVHIHNWTIHKSEQIFMNINDQLETPWALGQLAPTSVVAALPINALWVLQAFSICHTANARLDD